MANELEFDPKSLQDAGQKLQDTAARFQAEWQAMQGTVEGMGELFGDDTVSSLIGMTYQIAQSIANDSFNSASSGFHDFGGGLQAIAANYQATEDKNIENIDGTV